MFIPSAITVTPIETQKPPLHEPKAHHIGNPPVSFRNPWPSFRKFSTFNTIVTHFTSKRNFVPVPSRDELVNIRSPDWGCGSSGLKVTWIGHASFLVEAAAWPGASRGVRVLLDPVFSERTSPLSWLGPKRYTPVPCSVDALPEVDAVLISHNHYDHLDGATIRRLYSRRKGKIRFLCGLGNASWFVKKAGVRREDVSELDWWDGLRMEVANVGAVKLVCTPAQHTSGRALWTQKNTLWCSWVLEEVGHAVTESDVILEKHLPAGAENRKLYFAGDTGYRYVPRYTVPENEHSLPCCPAFADIGDIYGPFDLALLPIGLYSPRHYESPVHCAPEETACIHKDIRSKRSIGMHWGTVRGVMSVQFEDVREPPRRWKEVCERNGLSWGKEVGLCDIGETVVVE